MISPASIKSNEEEMTPATTEKIFRPVLFMLLINQISPFFLNPLPLSQQK
jgi:hypothetical protein